MGNIRILDKKLVNKIAAGEVIQNPASIIKELIENSLDAQADNIIIEVRDGGKSYIQVKDNGCGMDEEDAIKAPERYSTSKIKSAKDLFNIKTLGFRGEALASIAAVTKMKLITCTDKSITGTEVHIVDNKTKVDETGCPKGTIIEIKDIFYNTPARKKYLKTKNQELRKITDIVTRYALGFPEVYFKLTSDNNLVLLAPRTKFLPNIANIYGRNTSKQMLNVDYTTSNLQINGYISKPSHTKPNKTYQTFFVNNRYVENKMLKNALNNAYQTLVHLKRFPVCILKIEVKPKTLDVNVHPAKKQIKFSQEETIHQGIFDAVRQTLKKHELIPEITQSPPKQTVLVTKKKIKKKTKDQEKTYPVPKPTQELLRESDAKVKTEKLPDLTIVGQIYDTYILAQSNKALYLIDQHVAEERINYEKYMAQYRKQEIPTQALLEPIVTELDPRQFSLVKSNIELLKKLGFLVEEFGKNTIVIRTMPVILPNQNKQIVLDIIQELERAQDLIEEEKEKILIMKACKSSIKANQNLTGPEIRKIIKNLAKTKYPYSCPHGRPVLVKLTKKEIEKRFKRR
ncbi:MAG: DNA mismatch repair protein MutL [Candidatus Woesearchaeota archaeon]|nr:DNA mismatch repair protein MutL [Candidatus Woesearchaeota archaeon]